MTTAQTPDLRSLAEAAEGNGEHIYTHPRDSNKWRENEAWHRAASPGAVLHLLDRIHDLERKVGRIQGVPLPLIDALNAATGSHDWQGEAGPDALAEPACKAIAALQAERDEADRRAGAAERSAAAFHEDNQRFEQVRRRMKEQWGVHNNVSFDVVWQQALDAKQALAELEARKPLPPMEAIKLGMEAQQACRPHSTGTTNWAFAITRFYERRLVDKSPNLQEPLVDKTENLQGRSAPLIASREGVADGPVRVTRLHLTDEGRASLTSKAAGPLPGITGGSS